MVESKRALRGASEPDGFEESEEVEEEEVGEGLRPMRPTTAKKRGSQFMLPAATVMRPVTNEFPRRAPATTRQTRTAARIPKAGPRRRLMAVFASGY